MNRAVRVKILFILAGFLIFGVSSSTILERNRKIENVAAVDEKEISNEEPQKNNLTRALVTTLMRTSLLYIYLIMVVYYVILLESENLLTRVLSTIGKIMVLITIGTYLIAEYILPSKQLFLVITRLAIILLLLSFLQIIHLVICIARIYRYNALGREDL